LRLNESSVNKYIMKNLFKVIIFLLPYQIFGAVELKDHTDHYFVWEGMEYFCDTTGLLPIDQIADPSFQKNFQELRSFHITQNYERANWVKLTIRNNRSTPSESWVIESWGFDMDNMEFYAQTPTGFEKISMGYTQPFNERKIFHKNPVFPIYIDPGKTQQYFIKIQRHAPIHLTFVVRTQEMFIQHISYEYWYLGIFYGIFFFIAIVMLLLTIIFWDKLYLAYLFCVVSELMYCLRRDGMGFQFFWPDSPWLNYLMEYNIPQLLFIVATLVYAIEFLELKKKLPIFYYLCISAIVVRCLFFIGIQFSSYQELNIFMADFLFLLLPFIAGIASVKTGHLYARYYVFAFSCLLASFLLILMEDHKWLPLLPYNWYWINIGMLLKVLFLSLALASHIRYLRKQKEASNQLLVKSLKTKYSLKEKMNLELEKKVEERTEKIRVMLLQREEQNTALQKANDNLALLNEKVKQMNQLLNQDNQQLRSDVTQLGQSRVLLKDVTFEEFKRFFPDDSICFKYLADLKWSQGYKCKKCGYNKGVTDETRYGIRCKNCKYIESPTAGTLFHKLKFPITKAFYMMYLVYLKGKSLSLDELSEILDLRRETCWSFRKKILDAQEDYSKKGIYQSEHGWASIVMADYRE
jgi:hypothetical protein